MTTRPFDDPLLHKLHGVAVYNPDLLSEEELKAVFIARQDLLARLTEGLLADRPAHTLIVGVRGMGKTTLLRRLQYSIQDDTALCQRWVPLVFPEEQYNVARLSDFYLNCLDAMSDALESRGDRQHAREVDRFIEQLEGEREETVADAARKGLQEMSRRLDRGFVLLVDNVDRILDGLDDAAGWSFRQLLSEDDGIVLIGAGAQAVKSSYDHGQPFYDFFDVRELSGFSAEETERVLRSLAESTHHPQVAGWIDDDPARLKTLNTLSGGNPRTVVLLFQLLVQGIEGDVRSDLERLLDMCTPLYKARFEELAPQAQQILDALAMLWEPATAALVAEKVRLDVTKVSSQLSRLTRQGLVQKVPLPPGKRAGFQIAERFFNIWYLMRASRRVRRRLLWFAKFLKMFHSAPELRDRAQRYLSGDAAEFSSKVRHAEYGFALAHAVSGTEYSSAIEYKSIALLHASQKIRKQLGELLDLEGEDRELKPVAERLQLMAEARDHVMQCSDEAWPSEIDRNEFWRLLGGSLSLNTREKHAVALDLVRHGCEVIRRGNEVLLAERDARAQSTLAGLDSNLRDAFHAAVASGYLNGPADSSSARAAGGALGCPDLPKIVDYWAAETGVNKSEEAYRYFITLAPQFAHPWNGLGNLLSHHLARYEEAEQAYRQAIEIDPDSIAVNSLAWFLYQRGGDRLAEAEQLARRAWGPQQEDPHLAHTCATILVRNGRWLEAMEPARQFLDTGDTDFFERTWPDVVTFFHEAVRSGRASEAAALLDECGRSEQWRPLAEALLAVAEDSSDRLLRLAPEMREPAMQLYNRLCRSCRPILMEAMAERGQDATRLSGPLQ